MTGARFVPPAARRAALEAAAVHLRCPVCGAPVRLGDTQLICGNGHGFDIARQGYVNLTAGRAWCLTEAPDEATLRSAVTRMEFAFTLDDVRPAAQW